MQWGPEAAMLRNDQRRQLAQAKLHSDAGRTKRAITTYRQILRQAPECTDAMFQLAVLLHDVGELEAAANQLRVFLSYQPNLAEVHFNLGTIMRALSRPEEASSSFLRAIELQPGFSDAHNNLGTCYRDQGQLQKALECFEAALAQSPDSLHALINLGTTLAKCNRSIESVAVCRRALSLHPDSPDAHYALGIALEKTGAHHEAIDHLQIAVYSRPDVPEWQFHLAASQGASPPTAPTEYVTSLFDGYAKRFDDHLVSDLKYMTPQHLYRAVRQFSNRSMDMALDLGCGTGLSGEVFRETVRSFVGVDLSSEMIKVAQERHLYDELHVSEVTSFLEGRQSEYDLIVAADVFVYIGDLALIFSQASKALRNNGLFAFSVEANESDSYVLGATRRYSHALTYLRRLSAANGFTERTADSVVLREDHGRDVQGWVVVLEKSE